MLAGRSPIQLYDEKACRSNAIRNRARLRRRRLPATLAVLWLDRLSRALAEPPTPGNPDDRQQLESQGDRRCATSPQTPGGARGSPFLASADPIPPLAPLTDPRAWRNRCRRPIPLRTLHWPAPVVRRCSPIATTKTTNASSRDAGSADRYTIQSNALPVIDASSRRTCPRLPRSSLVTSFPCLTGLLTPPLLTDAVLGASACSIRWHTPR